MEHNCKDCKYFRQHYSLDGERIFRVYCGHCTEHKVKRKQPDNPACEKFVQASADENAFVTKEYLSKKLLQYLLELELLPEIENIREI